MASPPRLRLASASLTSRAFPSGEARGIARWAPYFKQPVSAGHHSSHRRIMRQELDTGHGATGWPAWGWCLAGSLHLPEQTGLITELGHDRRHLGVGTSPRLVMTLRTGWCSQELGSKRAIWALGSLLSPSATLQGASGVVGLPRWLSNKESAC